ncbi:MAG: monovalent cation/H(+) antiporter subunit G [Pseudomonadota bacterium]
MIDALIGCLLLLGGAFAVVGSLGLVRMQDVLIRMHSSSKIGTLSTMLTVLGAAIWFNDMGVTVRVILIVLFLLLTAPIASHMIGRAAVAIGVPLWSGNAEHNDDLKTR